MAIQGSDLLLSIFLFMVTLFCLHPATATTGDATAKPDSIDQYCAGTLDPVICARFLRPYEKTINGDPNMLVWFPVSRSYSMAQDLSSYIAANCSGVSSLHECSSNLKTYTDNLSVVVGDPSNKTEKRNMKPHINNLKTWISEELSSLDSCFEGSKGVKDDAEKEELEEQVGVFKDVTEAALVFVNRYE